MDKGIRPACNAKFMELLPQRAELGNTRFRKTVMSFLMDEFGCTNPSAATHYNHSFQKCKKENPELVVGLGRPDGKNNGGRKKKAEAAGDVAPVNFFPCGGFVLLPAPTGTLISQGVKENTSTQTVTVNPPAGDDLTPDVETQTVFAVRKKADDSMIAEGLSFEAAQALVAKAAAAKKAKLYFV
jgi:hypothetical protein